MSAPTDLSQLKPGFADPARDAQRAFRLILDALSRPGRVQVLDQLSDPPAGLDAATAVIALTLFDFETPLWLDPALRGGAVQTWLRFHCSCPLTEDPSEAAFAIVVDPVSMPRLDLFNRGEDKYPDRSTSVIVQTSSLVSGPRVDIRGPGIRHRESICAHPLPTDFWQQMHENSRDFQLGVDVALTAGTQMLGLPRTVQSVPAAGAATPQVEMENA